MSGKIQRRATLQYLAGNAFGVTCRKAPSEKWFLDASLKDMFLPPSASASAIAANDMRNTTMKYLKKPLLNAVLPKIQQFPAWMKGEWLLSMSFNGYEFPNPEIFDKKRLLRDKTVPGFQKLSIATVGDVGKDVMYNIRFVDLKKHQTDGRTSGFVVEDRVYNLANSINANLKEEAQKDSMTSFVKGIQYNEEDPNRTSVAFNTGSNRNAERIELFTNFRDSELSEKAFETEEAFRQVTLSYGTQYGVAREIITDFINVWTYILSEDSVDTIDVTLTTACFVQPNNALKYTNMDGGAVPDASRLLKTVTDAAIVYHHNGHMQLLLR